MSNLNENKALQLLELFVCRDSEYFKFRDKIKAPYAKDGYICATDTYSLIRVGKEYIPSAEFKEIEGYNIKWNKPDTEIVLSRRLIKLAIDNLPLIDEYKTEEQEIACPECEGRGNVEWEYEDRNGNMHYDNFVCPVCDGFTVVDECKKVPTGKKIIDEDYNIKIRDSYIKGRNLLKLFNAMEICDIEEISIVNFADYSIMFNMCENIDVMIATIRDDDAKYKSHIVLI